MACFPVLFSVLALSVVWVHIQEYSGESLPLF